MCLWIWPKTFICNMAKTFICACYIIWVFYLCAIIKYWNDLCTIEIWKSSPIPSLKFLLLCIPLPSACRSILTEVATNQSKNYLFYLCAIIKVQNDLCTIEKTKSSPVPLLEIFVPYVPLPSISPVTAGNGQRKWQFYTQLWYATKFSHFPLMPLACFFGFKKLSFSSVALWQLVCAHKNSNKYKIDNCDNQ